MGHPANPSTLTKHWAILRSYRRVKSKRPATLVDMSTAQTWDPASYAKHARFVSDLGSSVLELLSPKPGERVLDLGCGDGILTKKIADLGCEVVAIDSSVAFIDAARKLGLDAHVIDAVALPYREEFDAVFSNAVLHWIKRADEMIAGVYRSLRPGGRFVAECGGFGCVDKIRRALVESLDKRGIHGEARVPWYFPTPGRLRNAPSAGGVSRWQHRPDSTPNSLARRYYRLP